MASIIMKRGTASEISNTPISDGQILFETDTKNIYIDEGSNRIKYTTTIDNKLSATSENPVQNKVITNKVNDLEDRINTINPQADSGYVIIGDTLIQWGNQTLDKRSRNNYVYTGISLPIPFANSTYTINLTLNYDYNFSAYYDATPNYTLYPEAKKGFWASAHSKSGAFTNTDLSENPIAISWIAIGKY